VGSLVKLGGGGGCHVPNEMAKFFFVREERLYIMHAEEGRVSGKKEKTGLLGFCFQSSGRRGNGPRGRDKLCAGKRD